MKEILDGVCRLSTLLSHQPCIPVKKKKSTSFYATKCHLEFMLVIKCHNPTNPKHWVIWEKAYSVCTDCSEAYPLLPCISQLSL